jgi:hypothetical protein
MEKIPVELILEIYKLADYETRINLNKAYNLNFNIANPFFDYNHPDGPTVMTPVEKNIIRICNGLMGMVYSS